jgi:hypothetical protein
MLAFEVLGKFPICMGVEKEEKEDDLFFRPLKKILCFS